MSSVRYENVMAADRLDVFWEEKTPRWPCAVEGCQGRARYERESTFGHQFWVCSSHQRLYSMHDRIVKRILSL